MSERDRLLQQTLMVAQTFSKHWAEFAPLWSPPDTQTVEDDEKNEEAWNRLLPIVTASAGSLMADACINLARIAASLEIMAEVKVKTAENSKKYSDRHDEYDEAAGGEKPMMRMTDDEFAAYIEETIRKKNESVGSTIVDGVKAKLDDVTKPKPHMTGV